ncbi:MAG: hypothetical protein JXB00_06145 [Bacteroidales bacterium]|nr:hypothetical protein [Bacteroidales bacterium]
MDNDLNYGYWVNEIYQFPEFIGELSVYQIAKIKAYIKRRQIEIYADICKTYEADTDMLRKIPVNERPPLLPFKDRKPRELEVLSKVLNLLEKGHHDQNTVIDKNCLIAIHNRYQDVLKEKRDTWIDRFVYPNPDKINGMGLSDKATEGSSKLIVIAILAAIQEISGNTFVFNDFVLSRFGIKDYQKLKTMHQEKITYKKTLQDCRNIIKTIAGI